MYKTFTSSTISDNTYSSAIFSKCKRYRYALTRSKKKSANLLLFILLNPSTATEIETDPTITRCQKRASLLGYHSFRVCNLFAFRTKTPAIMKAHHDPIGFCNDMIINYSLREAKQVICAWGSHGNHLNRAEIIKELVRRSDTRAFHLGLTKNNQPKHPLYLRYSEVPIEWLAE